MSGFLLDTNILIALVNGTQRKLPKRLQEVLAKPGSKLAISVVSPWETAIKTAAGRLQIDLDVALLGDFIGQQGCDLLPMTIDHALEFAHPEPATKDPFDRLLLAVCACEGMKLLTTDARLAGHRLVY